MAILPQNLMEVDAFQSLIPGLTPFAERFATQIGLWTLLVAVLAVMKQHAFISRNHFEHDR